MPVINIQTKSACAAPLSQQVVRGYSFNISNALKNISKVVTSIFFLYGLTNLAQASAEMSNEHCKELCRRFLTGQGTDVMDNCFLFCDKTYLN